MADVIDTLRAIPDPVARWCRVVELEEDLRLTQGWLAAVRTEIVVQLRSGDRSLQQVADLLGVSKTRVAEIEKQRTV